MSVLGYAKHQAGSGDQLYEKIVISYHAERRERVTGASDLDVATLC